MEDYITVETAAERLALSKQRVCQLCNEGKLPGAQMWSGVWVIPETAVASFVRTPPGWPVGRKRGSKKKEEAR